MLYISGLDCDCRRPMKNQLSIVFFHPHAQIFSPTDSIISPTPFPPLIFHQQLNPPPLLPFLRCNEAQFKYIGILAAVFREVFALDQFQHDCYSFPASF